jgi:hypothetical protein
MALPPISVISLLFVVCVRVLVIWPVVVCEVHSPWVTLMVIPVVIIAVTQVIDAYLYALLRHRRGHH